MLLFMLIGVAIVALAHTAPAPFALDALAGDLAVWHMPRSDPPTIYLTYDDGPNPATTPDLLDVLKREEATATFFLIDRHLTEETRSDRPADVCRRTCRRAALRVAPIHALHAAAARQNAHRRGRSHRIARRHPPLPRLSAARRLAGRIDVRGAEVDRLQAGGLGLDALGLQLVSPPNRRRHRRARRRACLGRRHRGDARRRRIGAATATSGRRSRRLRGWFRNSKRAASGSGGCARISPRSVTASAGP